MKRKPLSLGARFGLLVLSSVLGIGLFFAALAASSIASVRVLTSENTIQEVVRLVIGNPVRIHRTAMADQSSSGLRVVSHPGVRTYAIPRLEKDDAQLPTSIVISGNIDPSDVTIGEDGTIYIDGVPIGTVPVEGEDNLVIVGPGVDTGDLGDTIGAIGGNSSVNIGNITGGSISDQFIESIYSELEAQMGSELNISLEEVKDLVDQSTVKDFISEKAASLITDYYTGEVTTTFDPEEIRTLIDENSELIESLLGEPLPEEVKDQIVQWVDESEAIQQVEQGGLKGILQANGMDPDQILGGNPSGKPSASGNGLGEQVGEVLGSDKVSDTIAGIAGFLSGGQLQGIDNVSDILTLLRMLTTERNLYICIGICGIFMVLILLVNIRQISKGIRRCGYPLIFAGGLFVIFLFARSFVPNNVDPILSAAKLVMTKTMYVHGIVFGIGALLFIAGIISSMIAAYRRPDERLPVFVGAGSPKADKLSTALDPVVESVASVAPVEEAVHETAAENTTEGTN